MNATGALDRLDFRAVEEEHPDRYHRGSVASTSIVVDDADRFVVSHPDSDDSHVCRLAVAGRLGYFGSCSCDGYEYHDGPCSHLCAIERMAEIGHVDVPHFDIQRAVGDVRDPEQERADAEDDHPQASVTGDWEGPRPR